MKRKDVGKPAMDQFELLIAKSLDEFGDELNIFNELQIPDKERVWRGILNNIYGERAKKRCFFASGGFSTLAKVMTILICITCVSAMFSIFFNSKQVNALRQGFIVSLQNVGKNVFGINFDGEDVEFEPIDIKGSLDDIQDAAPIPIPFPKELPEGYSLAEARYIQRVKDKVDISLIYEDGEEYIRIIYKYKFTSSNNGVTEQTQLKEGGFQEMSIDGRDVYYNEDGLELNLIFQKDDFIITIAGNLSLEEATSIYQSIITKKEG